MIETVREFTLPELREIGRYRIEKLIAQGGMGEVFLATVDGPGAICKKLALKLVRSDLVGDAHVSRLFIEEIRVCMTLSHANIVQAFDVGRIDERWFLAMEYVQGMDLAQALYAGGAQPLRGVGMDVALTIAIECLKGLDYAHRRKAPDGTPLAIIHRDVSPGNILLSLEGEVKITDFGVAKSTMRDVGSVMGTVRGKIPYMPPEQVRGNAVDRRVDIYALGAVVFEMLVGRRLFPKDGAACVPLILAGAGQALLHLEKSVPPELVRILKRALSSDPDIRYATAAAMRQDLERFAMSEGVLVSSEAVSELVASSLELESGVLHDADTETGSQPEGRSPTSRAVDVAFDQLLGKELSKVAGNEPYSVYTISASADCESGELV